MKSLDPNSTPLHHTRICGCCGRDQEECTEHQQRTANKNVELHSAAMDVRRAEWEMRPNPKATCDHLLYAVSPGVCRLAARRRMHTSSNETAGAACSPHSPRVCRAIANLSGDVRRRRPTAHGACRPVDRPKALASRRRNRRSAEKPRRDGRPYRPTEPALPRRSRACAQCASQCRVP